MHTRISAALKARYPALDAAFGNAATHEEIATAEADLGVSFPDDLRLFLGSANGQALDGSYEPIGIPVIPPLPFGVGPEDRCTWGEFLRLDQIVLCTRANRELSASDAEVSLPPAVLKMLSLEPLTHANSCDLHGSAKLHRNQIIFCDPGSGDAIGIDLDPADGGTVGQVVAINHDPFAIGVLANSFADFISDVAMAIESGDYVFSEDDGWVMR